MRRERRRIRPTTGSGVTKRLRRHDVAAAFSEPDASRGTRIQGRDGGDYTYFTGRAYTSACRSSQFRIVPRTSTTVTVFFGGGRQLCGRSLTRAPPRSESGERSSPLPDERIGERRSSAGLFIY
jgi:hypothetical protein